MSSEEAPALLLRARQIARRLGITFHVGSQAVVPARLRRGAAPDRAIDRGRRACWSMPSISAAGFRAAIRIPTRRSLPSFMDEIVRAADELAVKHNCELLCEPGRALVAEAKSVIVRVDARRGNALYVNDGAFGTLFDAAYCGFRFPARLVATSRPQDQDGRRVLALRSDLRQRRLSCRDRSCCRTRVREGDYIEIGQIGAYGRVLANRFNGFGEYDEVILTDEPMLSMYLDDEEQSGPR